MKQLFTLCLVLFASMGMAQEYAYKGLQNFPVSTQTGRVTYEGVVPADGQSAQQLYSAAKEWIARNSNAKQAIETEVPGEKIIGKGELQETGNKGHVYTYDFILSFKDGRYRYELTNIVLHYNYGTAATRGSYGLESYPKDKASGSKAQKLDSIYAGIHHDFQRTATHFASLHATTEKDW